MKKGIRGLAATLATVMAAALLPLGAFAADAHAVRTQPLNLAQQTADDTSKWESEGWKWEHKTKTLTLQDCTIRTPKSEYADERVPAGISLPMEEVTIVLLGKNTVETTDSTAIVSTMGGVTIKSGAPGGSLSIKSGADGIAVVRGSLTIEESSLDIDAANICLYVVEDAESPVAWQGEIVLRSVSGTLSSRSSAAVLVRTFSLANTQVKQGGIFKRVADWPGDKLVTLADGDVTWKDGKVQGASSKVVLEKIAGDAGSVDSAAPRDVTKSDWCYDAVMTVLNAKVMDLKNGDFQPNTAMKREEIAQALHNLAKHMGKQDVQGGMAVKEAPDYADISDDAKEAMNFCFNAAILRGDDKGKLNPKASVSREEMAALLERYFAFAQTGAVPAAGGRAIREFSDYDAIQSWAHSSVSFCLQNGIMKGNSNGSFNPSGSVSRAECAQMLTNIMKTA